MDIKDILFKNVQCSTFLKKVYDGKFIQVCKGDIEEAAYCDSNKPDAEIMSECCGEHDFLKTYYEVKERNFTGFVVGIVNIVTTAWLVAETNYRPYDCAEYLKIYREPNEKIQCVIVYYQNNRKRYVPLENIKVGD